MYCKYNDMFGKIGMGMHSYRIFNVAIVDVLFTIIGAFIIHLFYQKISFVYVLIFLFVLGIICHLIFCVRTTVDKFLFRESG